MHGIALSFPLFNATLCLSTSLCDRFTWYVGVTSNFSILICSNTLKIRKKSPEVDVSQCSSEFPKWRSAVMQGQDKKKKHLPCSTFFWCLYQSRLQASKVFPPYRKILISCSWFYNFDDRLYWFWLHFKTIDCRYIYLRVKTLIILRWSQCTELFKCHVHTIMQWSILV